MNHLDTIKIGLLILVGTFTIAAVATDPGNAIETLRSMISSVFSAIVGQVENLSEFVHNLTEPLDV